MPQPSFSAAGQSGASSESRSAGRSGDGRRRRPATASADRSGAPRRNVDGGAGRDRQAADSSGGERRRAGGGNGRPRHDRTAADGSARAASRPADGRNRTGDTNSRRPAPTTAKSADGRTDAAGQRRPHRRRQDDNGTAGSVPRRGDQFAAAPVAAAASAPTSIPTVVASGPVPTFAELGVPTGLLAALTELGALSPFPIQAATLPATLAGRDVLGRGRTGSGKTIAFAIPLVARLTGRRSRPGHPRGLILVPTRELAAQVARTVQALATPAGLSVAVVFGGVGYGPQTDALRRGVDILVACPGRLSDLVEQGSANLGAVEVTVLDEADHMADLGFLPGVRRLLRRTPAGSQRLLFSATLDNGVSVLVDEFLADPVRHSVDESSTPVAAMTHHVFAVARDDRAQVVREIASGTGRRVLFTRTKHAARKWARQLSSNGIPAVDLHGNLSQNARTRNLAAFSDGSARVLVATDIAARGIHVDDVELVVHLDPPAEHKAYLHRSGRTARAGAAGTVVTMMLPEQSEELRTLMRQAGIRPSTTSITPGHPMIAQVTG